MGPQTQQGTDPAKRNRDVRPPSHDLRAFTERHLERAGIIALKDLHAAYSALFPGTFSLPEDMLDPLREDLGGGCTGASYLMGEHGGVTYLAHRDLEPRETLPRCLEIRSNDEALDGAAYAGSNPPCQPAPPGGPADSDQDSRPAESSQPINSSQPLNPICLQLLKQQKGHILRPIDPSLMHGAQTLESDIAALPAFQSLDRYMERQMPRARFKYERLRNASALWEGLLEIARAIAQCADQNTWSLLLTAHHARLLAYGPDREKLDAPIEDDLAARIHELLDTIPRWGLKGWSKREIAIRDLFQAARKAEREAKRSIARIRQEASQVAARPLEKLELEIDARSLGYQDRLAMATELYSLESMEIPF